MGQWQRALRDAEDLTRTERYVGLMQSTWFDFEAADGKQAIETYVSQGTLAERCGLHRETVRKALRALVSKGYLHALPRPGDTTVYGARIPDGADVITLHPPPNGGDHHSPTAETTTPQRRRPRPKQDRKQYRQRAPTSLTDDEEIYQAMLDLAAESGARSPKAWVAKVYAEDIAPIIEQQGRDAGLAEIQRRTVEGQRRQKRRTRHRPPDDDHGSKVAVTFL